MSVQVPTVLGMPTKTRTQLTVGEVAAALGMPARTVQYQCETGKIPAVKLPGATGAYLISKLTVERLRLEREAEQRAS